MWVVPLYSLGRFCAENDGCWAACVCMDIFAVSLTVRSCSTGVVVLAVFMHKSCDDRRPLPIYSTGAVLVVVDCMESLVLIATAI